MIDWDRVASLRAEIGADDFAEVADMFLVEADEVIERLLAGSAGAELEAHLHFLKGSALNLGFADLAVLCSEGEKRAAGGEAVDVARVIRCYASSRLAFESAAAAVTSAA
jgi:HPt (histidine-containing phosphotransfer) domain-containing protein